MFKASADLDQDHYGGLAAVEALARLGGRVPDSRVLDLCCGLGGPRELRRRRCPASALQGRQARYDEYDQLYGFFGGGRFSATRPA